jgi:hypothetical protein
MGRGRRLEVVMVHNSSPRRQWWYSWWFAVVAILFAIGGIALAVFLIAWAIAPSIA